MSVALLAGEFTSISQSDWVSIRGSFNLSIRGGIGMVKLEKSYDKGVTEFDVSKNSDGDVASWAISNNEISVVGDEPESDILYRLHCTSYTSGTIVYRLSQ